MGLLDQHAGRIIYNIIKYYKMFLSTKEVSGDNFIRFIHQNVRTMMMEKWKKRFLHTSRWSKVLMHPWPGLFSGLFYFPAFFVRSIRFRVTKKTRLGDSQVEHGLPTARPIFQRVGKVSAMEALEETKKVPGTEIHQRLTQKESTWKRCCYV